ncbi:hypothetical protein [Christiangramia sabulilitoris]|nr:hypothetical protein [Christiangramia sabulilitoris]
MRLGGVMASSAISVVAAGFFILFPKFAGNYLTTHIPSVVMGASFIGMATYKMITSSWVIALSGLLFPVIYLFSGSFFEGYGGSLGTSAAIALGSVFFLQWLIIKIQSS